MKFYKILTEIGKTDGAAYVKVGTNKANATGLSLKATGTKQYLNHAQVPLTLLKSSYGDRGDSYFARISRNQSGVIIKCS